MNSDKRWKIWSGYAFESLCFKHVAEIKKKLGIAAVLTNESQWSYRPKDRPEKGALTVSLDLI